ncbi:transposase domain-containing protein, partial [Escherichia coli]
AMSGGYLLNSKGHGGERGVLLYGLISTCRLKGIDPEAYLRHILSVLPEWPSNRVDELLPWNAVNKCQYGAALTLTFLPSVIFIKMPQIFKILDTICG